MKIKQLREMVMSILKCAWCKISFKKSKFTPRHRYCSSRCYANYYYHKINKKKHLISSQKNLARNKKETRRKLQEYKVKHGCKICGYNRCATALTFHHLRGKKFLIGSGSNESRYWTPRLEAEINKCAVLCENCHREVHAGLSQIYPDKIK